MMKSVLRTMLSVMMMMVCTMLFAQTDDDQLLVFRNTGEVYLLYTSQIDSITTTCTDTLGVTYEEPVAQIFHAQDTTLYVSIAEIDSVCFGSRNEIEYRNDVRVLSKTEDEQWIIRCEGNCIYYKVNTPANILPTVGQKLYYPELSDLFPYGLSVKVEKVTKGNSEIAVQVEQVGYEDIFSKFFYAGSLSGMNGEVANAKRRAGEVDRAEPINLNLVLGDYGSVAVNGGLSITGDVVLNIFKHYYHADLAIETSIGTEIKATAKESASHSFVEDFVNIPLPVVAAVFKPSVRIGLFTDLNAELVLKYSMTRKNTTHISWTRENGNNTFIRKPSSDSNDNANQANIDIILDGSIFSGVQTTLDFALVGDLIGARAKLKYGTELGGELSMGVLSDLSREYNASTYGSAELTLTSKVVFEGCAIHREAWVWGDIDETPLLDYTHQTGQLKLDLLPHFTQSRATRPQPNAKDVSVATKTNNTIAYELETGFQIINGNTKEVVDSVFVDEKIKADMEEIQTFDTKISLPGSINEENLEMRPVFHYSGYTIPFENVGIAQNPNIQPVICFGTNGAVTYVSGVPIVDITQVDSTTYHIGPFLPVAVYDKDFHDKSPYVSYDVVPIRTNGLIGTWECEMNDTTKVQLTFNADMTSSLKENEMPEQNGEYSLNTPQSGYVTMTFDADCESIVFVLESIDNQEMKVRFRKHYPQDELYVFRKQEE